MNLRNIGIIFLLSMFVLTACMNNDNEQSLQPTGKNRDLELIKLSSTGVTDQQVANQAKEILSHYEEITSVRAVNAGGHLLIAIDIEHYERFELDNIEHDLQKEIKKNFKNMKVTLSTDQKILLELKQLEEDIEAQSIHTDDLKKRVKELVDLSKEQT